MNTAQNVIDKTQLQIMRLSAEQVEQASGRVIFQQDSLGVFYKGKLIVVVCQQEAEFMGLLNHE